VTGLRWVYGITGAVACVFLAMPAGVLMTGDWWGIGAVVFFVAGTTASTLIPAKLISMVQHPVVRVLVAPVGVAGAGVVAGLVATLLSVASEGSIPNPAGIVFFMSIWMTGLVSVVGLPIQLLIELALWLGRRARETRASLSSVPMD
jgi:Na+/H+-translocating membrane pyrophosphatase